MIKDLFFQCIDTQDNNTKETLYNFLKIIKIKQKKFGGFYRCKIYPIDDKKRECGR